MQSASDLPRPILLLGPTAGGKSQLAADLAQELNGEVISVDAFQLYKRLDASTAKPDHAQRAQAPHHLIDTIEPTEKWSVSEWLSEADRLTREIQSRGLRPILTGGTHLYVRAWLEGLFEGPPADPAFRASCLERPLPLLYQELKQQDSDTRIHANDRQRIIRALEVFHATGTPLSQLQRQWQDGAQAQPYRHNPILIGLDWATEHINSRINLRVKAMFYPHKVDESLAQSVCIGGENLPDESARLLEEGWFAPLADGSPNQAREALGTKQCLAVLEQSNRKQLRNMSDAFEKTKVLTRRFAKQQRTWFKHFRDVHWIANTAETSAPDRLQMARACL